MMMELIDKQKAIYIASGFCHWSNIPKELEKLPTVQAVPIEVLQEIRQEIESNMESITGKYDKSTPTRDLPSYKIERNEGRKECIKLIDSKIKELSE